ncbi:MAG: hypothetical protein ABSG56_00815 [Bryobacteraceae bacterium]|jgi:uncharacterized protein (TIGR03437 family)
MDKRCVRLLAVSLLSAAIALAQPVIGGSAVSSASYRTPGMPGSGVAQGSIFIIFGTGLGPTALVEATTFPLQTTLGGTSVSVTVGGAQQDAILLYTYSYAVAAILPSTTPVGSGTFTVTYNGQISAPAPIQVVASAFGIYTLNEQGSGQAIATDTNYNVNTIIHTFHPGDYVTLWGTGLGAINASDATVPPFGNVGSVTVYVGNAPASVVTYHGRSGFAGLDQINFQIPAGVTGCYVPVAVQAGGVPGNIGNMTTIAVSAIGTETCSDSVMGQDLVNQLAAGQTVDFGYIRLESWVARYISDSAGNATEDFGIATFSEYTPANAGLAQYGVSSGYCVAVDCSTECGGANLIGFSLSDSSPAQLDAGAALTIGYPITSLPQAQFESGFYEAYLSGNGRFLYSAFTYPVTGTGGAAVGAFSVNDVTGIPSATLAGLNNAQTVPLSGDLKIQWTGGNPALQNGQVTISAESWNQPTSNTYQIEFLQCTAPASAQEFTIPAWVLAALPPSGSITEEGEVIPGGWIQVGQYNKPTTFSATGLTTGIITDIFYNGIGVFFQ